MALGGEFIVRINSYTTSKVLTWVGLFCCFHVQTSGLEENRGLRIQWYVAMGCYTMQFTWLDSHFSGSYKRSTDTWKGSYCILGMVFP